jgi:hypothetical protein
MTLSVNYTDLITKDLEKYKQQVKKLAKDSLIEFKSLTPIRSGNARRNTTLQGDTIVADYPYAERLDEGYSNQAPDGMIKPFEKWISTEVNKIFTDKK